MNPANRFAGEPRTPIVAMQWADWAQAIAGRHTLAAARHQHVTLTLARRQFVFRSARSETNAWTFAPQIRLAISSFLPMSFLQSAHKSQTRPEPDVKRTVREQGETGNAIRTDQDSAANGALNPGSLHTAFVLHRPQPPMRSVQNTPLERLIARLKNTETRTRPKQLALQPTTQLARRVTQRHRRVEERTNRASFVLQNPSAANVARSAQRGQEFNNFELPIPRGRTGSVPWETPNALPINLEQLTDQVARRIDNRITAYRERRGKGA